jgi:hypothetical protein
MTLRGRLFGKQCFQVNLHPRNLVMSDGVFLYGSTVNEIDLDSKNKLIAESDQYLNSDNTKTQSYVGIRLKCQDKVPVKIFHSPRIATITGLYKNGIQLSGILAKQLVEQFNERINIPNIDECDTKLC